MQSFFTKTITPTSTGLLSKLPKTFITIAISASVITIAQATSDNINQQVKNASPMSKVVYDGDKKVNIPAPVIAEKVEVQAVEAVKESPKKVEGKNPEEVYKTSCLACHLVGIAGAPKVGDKASWAAGIASGIDTMLTSTIKGKGIMPPRGGNADLTDAELKATIQWMIEQ